MTKRRRITAHQIETETRNAIRSMIDADGTGLFRELSEKDYGVDGIVEVFDNGGITGKFALIQCKGQEDKIEPLAKSPEYISCSGISASNLDYAKQNNSVVILTYASVDEKDVFYFIKLNDAITEEQFQKAEDGQKTFTVRIPVANNSRDNMPLFWECIDEFYNSKNP